MKNLVLFACCFFMLHFCAIAQSQDNMEGSLGLPGDNLNLYAVMKLFQESKTLEQFEKNLNDENSQINNLDLNGDGKIDYISVVDNFDGKVHTIVLKDPINANENQDVAVFYVGRDTHNKPQIQLIGDEALYGKDYIIEPNTGGSANGGQTSNPGYSGNREVIVDQPVVMETSAWPLLSFLFLPSYIAWHSPYYYGYYPNYWRPWQPLFWHSYYGYHSNMNRYYEGNFRHTVVYRDTHFRDRYYAGHRSFAPTVIRHRNDGFYKKSYSHPELRKVGAAQYSKTHPANLNRQSNRPEVNNRNQNPGNRQIGNRPSGNQLNNRPATRPGVNNSRPAVNQNNSRAAGNQNKSIPASRQSVNQSRPSVNQGNARNQATRPAPSVNQNNARTYTRPAAATQQSRPTANPQQNRPANNQVQSRPAPARQPAQKAAPAPKQSKAQQKKENNK